MGNHNTYLFLKLRNIFKNTTKRIALKKLITIIYFLRATSLRSRELITKSNLQSLLTIFPSTQGYQWPRAGCCGILLMDRTPIQAKVVLLVASYYKTSAVRILFYFNLRWLNAWTVQTLLKFVIKSRWFHITRHIRWVICFDFGTRSPADACPGPIYVHLGREKIGFEVKIKARWVSWEGFLSYDTTRAPRIHSFLTPPPPPKKNNSNRVRTCKKRQVN